MTKQQNKAKGTPVAQVEYRRRSQPNALLTFVGEQDATAFSVVCDAIEDRWQEESGGSRELSVRADVLAVGQFDALPGTCIQLEGGIARSYYRTGIANRRPKATDNGYRAPVF